MSESQKYQVLSLTAKSTVQAINRKNIINKHLNMYNIILYYE
jgi:hypothetical protein